MCPWALWILRRPQGDGSLTPLPVSLPQVATGLPGLEEKGKDRELSAWMLQKVCSFQICCVPPVWLSWAVCVGPSEHRVDLLLVAHGPIRLSVSKTRAFHLAFKDLRAGESPCLAGISTACYEALGKAVNLSGPCPFAGMKLHLLQAFLGTMNALSEPRP